MIAEVVYQGVAIGAPLTGTGANTLGLPALIVVVVVLEQRVGTEAISFELSEGVVSERVGRGTILMATASPCIATPTPTAAVATPDAGTAAPTPVSINGNVAAASAPPTPAIVAPPIISTVAPASANP